MDIWEAAKLEIMEGGIARTEAATVIILQASSTLPAGKLLFWFHAALTVHQLNLAWFSVTTPKTIEKWHNGSGGEAVNSCYVQWPCKEIHHKLMSSQAEKRKNQ